MNKNGQKWEYKEPRIARTILKKKTRVEGFALSHFRSSCKASAPQTAWYWQRDKYVSRWGRTENPQGPAHARPIDFQPKFQNDLTGTGVSFQRMVLKQLGSPRGKNK